MRRATISVGVTAFCLIVLYAGNVAADWPQWRGPNRDAKATDFQAPANWPKELTKKWQVTVGDGVATPALVDGKLYVFTREDGQEILRCLDAATGDEKWKEGYEEDGATGAAGGFSGPRSSPAVANDKVVTLGVRGVLICRDAATGKKLWRKDELANAWPQFFTSSSPLIVDGLCIAQLGGRDEGGIVAYDLATGDEKWRWKGNGPAYGSPVLMEVGGTKAIFAPTEGKMVAVSADGGKLLWEIPYSQGRYNSASPMVDGQTLIVAGPGTGLTAFKIEKQDDKLVESKVWNNTDNSVGFNTPVIKNGLMFGLSNADQLFCLDTKAEKTAWSAPLAKKAEGEPAAPERRGDARNDGLRTSATLVQFVQQEERDRPAEERRDQPSEEQRRGFDRGDRRPGDFGRGRGFGRFGRGGGGRGRGGYGSIVDVGTALVALSPAGELVVFQPADNAFTELARYKVADEGTYAYPVPADNGIYVKDQNALTLWTVE